MTIKVMIVDDSAMTRRVLTELINAQGDMQVIAEAPDPYVARELIKQRNPDVLTLDIEMPRMHGLNFLKHLMHGHPMPVLMISSLTAERSEYTLQALALGAVDYLHKPNALPNESLIEYGQRLAEKLRAAASANLKRISAHEAHTLPSGRGINPQVLAVGASTGGTEALASVLSPLNTSTPPVLIVQHMPAGFTKTFARRLDQLSALHVREAVDGEPLSPGVALLAPGGWHLRVRRQGGILQVALDEQAPRHHHRPSVDVLFESIASSCGSHAIGVLLTGMGKDGAQGMLAMHQQGALTIAQNQQSSVVFGMPKEAIALQAVDAVLPLLAIAPSLNSHFRWKT